MHINVETKVQLAGPVGKVVVVVVHVSAGREQLRRRERGAIVNKSFSAVTQSLERTSMTAACLGRNSSCVMPAPCTPIKMSVATSTSS